jgi:uncharacterized integral membrane protein (TIGR00697 family)
MSELICIVTFLALCAALMACVQMGRTAIYVFTVSAIVASNITVAKQIYFFGTTTSLGVFIFSAAFLALNIVVENGDENDGYRLVLANLAAQVVFMGYMGASVLTPAAQVDDASEAIRHLFLVTPRVTIAAIMAAMGGFISVAIFSFMKQRSPKGRANLAIRNFVSMVVGNSFNSVIFLLVAAYGEMTNQALFDAILAAVFAKLVMAILATPFMFVACRIRAQCMQSEKQTREWVSS